ncbi:Crp/Fnr family transcriptional regulator [Hyphomicrobium sp.]|uniref:Crp/Fnr family transcriptional regulator n=1 Tax=Hyphomicrobium sp. TaxID=82 RepID=UPI002E31C505|nr:Crp/Fnr family transcriptional regulator [Hyphomicrobium sp.]HEX2843459.1 Crp/Fnr family transcriptional regulator [Hyphomicrobium sp.]
MKNTLDVVSQQFERQAVRIATRKRQSHPLAPQPNETVYLIRKGLFLARIPMPGDQHHILSILYPGDVIRSNALRPLEGADILTASETGEAWRLRWSAVEALAREDHGLECQLFDSMADLAARLALHSAITAGLTGDERVAAMMIELALRTGKETHSGLTFEMPLSRIDIAEYLALNADTVSRIASRMRSNGLIAQSSARDHLACRSLAALEDACPLAPALRRLHAAPVQPQLAI